MKNFLKLITACLALLSLWYWGAYTIQRGKSTETAKIQGSNRYTATTLVRETGHIILLSGGELLTSPSKTTWSKRETFVNKRFSHISPPTEPTFFFWIYQLTLREAKSLLKNLASNGVDVRIILENNKYRQPTNELKTLREELMDKGLQPLAQSNIRTESDNKLPVKYTHAKTFIGPNFFIIQTANLTHSSYAKNVEHMYLGTNENVRQSLYALFETDRYTITKENIRENKNKKSQTGINSLIPAPFSPIIHPNLLICPLDCRAKLEKMLKNTQTSIWTFQQYISDPHIQDILTEKMGEKIDLRVIVPTLPDNKKLIPLRGGKHVKLLKSPYVHSKTFLIDDTYLIISSMNMSTNSMDNNREIGIIITDRTIIEQRKASFIKYRSKK